MVGGTAGVAEGAEAGGGFIFISPVSRLLCIEWSNIGSSTRSRFKLFAGRLGAAGLAVAVGIKCLR